ncbi:MAG: hypothetical protein J3R72DRAFT_262714 [Linnemannia gamsii]|nr:MAG: hypothetical protein J3R72DRAFT_262714 [Linnemannia gamsii]
MGSLLPTYSNPCLASSSSDNSTVFLIGVPKDSLQVSVVDISDINFPIVKSTNSSRPTYKQWTPDSPKTCFSYLGKSNSLPGSPIHIQQFGGNTTWNTIYFPETKVFGGESRIAPYDFMSRQNYAFVGQSGASSWAIALGDTIQADYNTSWNFLQYDGTSSKGNSSFVLSASLPNPLTADPLLTVGTLVVSPEVLAFGYLVVFDKLGGGVIYQSMSMQVISTATLKSSEVVDMDGIELTPNAIYANINTGAYIMDKADNDTVITYFIDPTISKSLQQVSTRNKPPPFPSSLAVTAAGPLIVLYSVTKDGPARFHFLNTTSKEWDMPYSPIPKPSPISESEGGNSAAAIGGAVGGIVLLVIVVFFFIRYRRQQRSKDNIQDLQFLDVDGITYDKTEGPSAKDYFATLEKPPLSEQRPQFPAGVGLVHGKGFEGDLSVSLLGPQGFPLNPQRYKPPPPRVDPANLLQYAYTQPNDVQSPQDWSHHQRTNINNGMNGYISPALRQPPTPPAIPTRPSNHVHYSLV